MMRVTALALAFTATLVLGAVNSNDAQDHQVERRELGSRANHARHHRRRLRRRNGTCKNNYKQEDTTTSSEWSPSPAAWTPTTTEAAANTWTAAANQVKAAADSSNNNNQYNAGSSSSSSGGNSGALQAAGVTAWQGDNSGIGSWFYTNDGSGTNGRSWCQCNYKDDWVGFAPDVSTMLANFGGDTNKAATAYCGAEVIATNPHTGMTATIYLADGFDPAWVRSPASIDLTRGAYKLLTGYTTDDHNNVIQGLQWKFTGNYNENMRFNKCNV